MNIYFEINKRFAKDRTNFVQYDAQRVIDRKLMERSDRIWEESENGVRYLKYRFGYPIPKVDMKEFMWIKLKSAEI